MSRKPYNFWPGLILLILFLILGILSNWNIQTYSSFRTTIFYNTQMGKPILPEWLLEWRLFSFVIFWLGGCMLYVLSAEIFKSYKWAAIAMLMYFLNPYVLGVSFKDLGSSILIAGIITSIFLALIFIRKPNFLVAVLLAMVNVLVICAHPVLVILPFLLGFCFLMGIFTRNLKWKDVYKILLFLVLTSVLMLMITQWANYNPFMRGRDFIPFSFRNSLWKKLVIIFNTTPPLWVVYFLFSIVSLNFVYFKNYYRFLKYKWVYTFLFSLFIGCFIMLECLPVTAFTLQINYVFSVPVLIIIGVGGCYEFAKWVRKKWGERVYFIFKFSFIPVFVLQCLWCIVAIIYLHPEYIAYQNWPMFWVAR